MGKWFKLPEEREHSVDMINSFCKGGKAVSSLYGDDGRTVQHGELFESVQDFSLNQPSGVYLPTVIKGIEGEFPIRRCLTETALEMWGGGNKGFFIMYFHENDDGNYNRTHYLQLPSAIYRSNGPYVDDLLITEIHRGYIGLLQLE